METTTIKAPSAYGDNKTIIEVKAVICKEVGTVYYYEGKEFVGVPMSKDGSFDVEEAFIVDEDLMEGEEYEEGKTFTQLYTNVRRALTESHYFMGYYILHRGDYFIVDGEYFNSLKEAETWVEKQPDTEEFER